jgi:hypothetical protein
VDDLGVVVYIEHSDRAYFNSYKAALEADGWIFDDYDDEFASKGSFIILLEYHDGFVSITAVDFGYDLGIDTASNTDWPTDFDIPVYTDGEIFKVTTAQSGSIYITIHNTSKTAYESYIDMLIGLGWESRNFDDRYASPTILFGDGIHVMLTLQDDGTTLDMHIPVMAADTSTNEDVGENDVRNGHHVVTYDDGGRYEGNFVNGERSGHGVYTFPTGGVYEGNWEDNQRSGQGKMTFADGGVYEGNWDSGFRSGYGVHTYPGGGVYRGNWESGVRSGQGHITYTDGGTYDGNWDNSERSGYGVYTYPNGNVYEGNWENNTRTGQGKMTFADGTVQEGMWEEGVFLG